MREHCRARFGSQRCVWHYLVSGDRWETEPCKCARLCASLLEPPIG